MGHLTAIAPAGGSAARSRGIRSSSTCAAVSRWGRSVSPRDRSRSWRGARRLIRCRILAPVSRTRFVPAAADEPLNDRARALFARGVNRRGRTRGCVGILFISLVLVATYSTVTLAQPGRGGGKPHSSTEGCQPRATPRDDVIVCTGTEDDELEAGRGDDSVVIEDGAIVSTTGLDPRPASTAIDGQAGDDTILNRGRIDVNVLSTGHSLRNIPGLGADADSVVDRAADDRRTATAIGIAGGPGADALDNAGVMVINAATITSDAGDPAGGAGTGAGPRASRALSVATGMDGGADDDWIVNSGSLTVTATSVVGKMGDSGNGPGSAGATLGDVTAMATAVGIRGGDGDDRITNTGDIAAIATASMVELDASGSGNGANPGPRTDSGSAIEATATGIDAGAGDDIIRNEQTVTADATATSPSVGVDLAARGGLGVDATASALSRSTGIDAGAGDDLVRNDGTVSSLAATTAFSVFGAVTTQGNSPSLDHGSRAGTNAEALASGVASGRGDDRIVNDGSIVATAIAEALAASGSLSIDGHSGASATSASTSRATGLDSGSGDDTVANGGSIVATATSLSQGLSVGVAVSDSGDAPASGNGPTPKRAAAVNAGATSEAIATGIVGDGVAAEESSSTRFTGAGITHESSRIAATGDNSITNRGSVGAVATATTMTGSGALAIDGEASASATSDARAAATGIDAGGGHDVVDNSGLINTVATAAATGLSVGVSITSDSTDGDPSGTTASGSTAAADAGVTAAATATGIAGDSDEGSAETKLELVVSSDAAVLDYRSTREAARGNDSLRNTGSIDVLANSISGAGAGSVTVAGDASARAASTANAGATGINAGAGDDAVENSGSLVAEAGAAATGLSAGVSLASGGDGSGSGDTGTVQSIVDSFTGPKATVDASVTADATATGIAGDATGQSTETEWNLAISPDGLTFDSRFRNEAANGQDRITNSGAVLALANAVSGAGVAEVVLDGDASANAASTATSSAMAIDAGGGDDRVVNTGALVAEAGAVAAGSSVGVGIASEQDGDSASTAGASSAAAEASVTARAMATGIRGDNGEGSRETETHLGIEVDAEDNTGGIEFARAERTFAATGDDTIDNGASVTVLANALSGAGGGAVALEGNATASAGSKAEGMATGIDAGTGDDRVANTGSIFAETSATATALSVGVGIASSGDDKSSSSVTADANVESEAIAAGILGDGGGTNTSLDAGLSIDPDGLEILYATHEASAAGDDRITNDGRIDAVAGAASGAGAAAIAVEGKASVESMSAARSTATGIGGGGGMDAIVNRGGVTATAASAAAALNVAVGTKGQARATGGIWRGGTDAQATASGIAGDSAELDRSTEFGLGADFDDLSADFRIHTREASVAGSDTIENDGAVTSTAVAESLGVDVAVAATRGVATAISSASAQARASGINAGGGDDEVINRGELITSAVANANAITVSVAGKGSALAGNAIWRGGATAGAVATGIDGDGEGSSRTSTITASVDTDGVEAEFGSTERAATGDDVIDNEGAVTSTAVAVTPAISVAVGVKGMVGAISSSQAESRAAAIDAGAGDDTIGNRGALKARATSVATAINVAVSPRSGAIAADAIWQGGTTADATAVGIDADGTSEDTFTETQLQVDADGASLEHASGSDIAGGRDVIANDARIDATAVAEAPAISVAVTVRGAGVASSTATADAMASAINAGDGADEITNDGELSATAVANANAVNVAVTAGTGAGLAGNPVWNGGTVSQSVARGIDADGSGTNRGSETRFAITGGGATASHRDEVNAASGADDIENSNTIEATATSVSAGVAVGVAVTGVSGAVATATARSAASAIDSGAGDDEIRNAGELKALATSVATSVNTAVTGATGVAIAADAVFDGGTTAHAVAKGIDADGVAGSRVAETTIAAGEDGATLTHERTEGIAGGRDVIVNEDTIGATATAVAPSVSVAVTVSGVGVAASTANSTAEATAIDAGAGDDHLTNRGVLEVNAVANADAVNVSVAPGGVAAAGNNVWNGGTVAQAVARGIDADGTAVGHSSSTKLGFDGDRATFSHGTSVDAARGDDFIDNDARIDVDAVAVTAGVAVGVTAGGAAAAISTSTAKSHATAIDAGGGSDDIDNSGELTATATSTAVAVNVGVAAGSGLAVAADAVWDGGTTAEATARGIDADGTAASSAGETNIAVGDAGARVAHGRSLSGPGGDDTITNDAAIGTTATAVAPSVSVAVAVTGVGVAASTATAQSEASAIDAGAGHDDIINRAALDVVSVANADAVNVSVTGAGVSLAGNNVFDGGVTAEARATGIDADGSADSTSTETVLTFDDGSAGFSRRAEHVAASGNDTIFNDAVIDADATAVSAGVAVTVPVAGVGLSASTATARATTRAIDAGSGDDIVITDAAGDLNATATSVAAAVNVSVTPAGVAAATDALWNGGTTAEATVKGIDADGSRTSTRNETTLTIDDEGAMFRRLAEQEPGRGDDTIINDARVDANSTAVSSSVGVSVAVAGVAAAASTATTSADAAGIDAGGGNDDITNRGELDVDAVSNANAVAVSVTPAGVAVTGDAVWDGGTTAEASAIGLAGDGSASGTTTESIVSRDVIRHRSITETAHGDDTILNEARIDAQAVSVAPALDVPVAVAGVAAAVSTSTARANVSAIDAGAGDDEITNRGELAATAVGNADTANVSVSVTGVALAGNAVWDGGTTVEAGATGIDADGRGSRVTNERSIQRDGDAITVAARDIRTSASGDDMIVNEADVTARATAVPVSVAVGVAAVGGVGAAVSTSTATSSATAINAGGGDDVVINDGVLEASANSTAVTVNGSFSLIGAGISGDALWDGGTTAEATAFGIDGDGRGATVTHERSAAVGPAGADTASDTVTVAATGNDDIDNTGSILAHAQARSPSVAVGLGGILGAAFATSTSTSSASAIDGGGGDDDIDNSGALTAIAESTAVAVNVAVGAVALSVNDVWDGGTTAKATATGIAGGAGNDTVTNDGAVSALADANAPSVSIALGAVLGAAVTTSTAESTATAIGGGDGDDVIHNTGALDAFADSKAVTVNLSSGLAALSVNDVWDGGTTATAKTRGIDGGDGANTIMNAARVESAATSNSTSPTVSVGLGVGVGAAISTSTAKSDAAALVSGVGDDSIDNRGVLIADSRADADTVNIALSQLGSAAASDAVWDGGTTAEARAGGMLAGAGGDRLKNRGLVAALSDATTTSTSVATIGVGVSSALAAATSTARSTAMDGGEGVDTIVNLGSLGAHGTADARGTSVSVGLIGAVTADASSNAVAASTGIHGGGGGDTLGNAGPLSASAQATARASAVEVAVLGTTVGNPLLDSGTTADATAIGMAGGAGDDALVNDSIITLGSTARTDATTVSVSLVDFGGGSADLSARAHARVTGMAGGAGADALDNSGVVAAAATAESPIRGVDVGLAGSARADFSTDADADARGIDGGTDDDAIVNSGLVYISAKARAPAVGTSVNLAGVTEQDASAAATATGAGLDGGGGDDHITNSGTVIAAVRSEATVSGSSWTLAGSSTQAGISNAVADITGIRGGAGRDAIANHGLVEAEATAMLETTGTSAVGIGGATTDATVNGDVTAIGIDGGGADDTIDNIGEIAASAHSQSIATGAAFALAGNATGRTGTTSAASATGISGGFGNDVIDNSGVLSARTTTVATASSSAWTLGGGATGDATLRAIGDSIGISGGGGSDSIRNRDMLVSDTTATLGISGDADTILFGGAGSGSSVSADVQAIGIGGGDGDDWIENLGSMTVTGTAAMTSSTAAFSLTGNPTAGAILAATSGATGVAGGSGADWMHNVGNVSVAAISEQSAIGGSRSGSAGSGSSSTTSRSNAIATGFDGGAGHDRVINEGTMTVNAAPSGTARNVATGGFLFGSAGAVSELGLSSTGQGVRLGGGDNVLNNAGSITVNAGNAAGDVLVEAKSVGGRVIDGNAIATVTVTGLGDAWGVQADDGDNVIVNDGNLSVLVDPDLRANKADANGNGVTDANGTAIATASATSTGVGIEVGDGNNQIMNNGIVTVSALPEARAVAVADADLINNATATARATATGEAVGIRTGNGDNEFINHGTISVLADPTASAAATATLNELSFTKTVCFPGTEVCKTITFEVDPDQASVSREVCFGILGCITFEFEITIGEKHETQLAIEDATAIGVEAGSGDDRIVNHGTITATEIVNGGEVRGTAIAAGAGNDLLLLGDGSSTRGHIDLGAGDDTLHLVGFPSVDGDIDSGGGTNSLIFEGTGAFSNPLTGFHNALKLGGGTYALPGLGTMKRLEIQEGTLQLDSGYAMGTDSTFSTIVADDGSHGRLDVRGVAALDGELVVERGAGAYTDGTTYDIITADSVGGAFDSESLPDPTALVSFTGTQLPDAYRVEASVKPFASVASNDVGNAVAGVLDDAVQDATGDMSHALGAIQRADASKFDGIYSGLSAESHDQFRSSTFDAMQRYGHTMHSRMSQLRARSRGPNTMTSADRTGLARDASLAQYGPVSGVVDLADDDTAFGDGMWISAFGQDGVRSGGNGYTTFDYRTVGQVPLGFDVALGDNFFIGFAAGRSRTEVERDHGFGQGESTFATVYGTWLTRKAHVEAVVSRSSNRYEGVRVMSLGDENRVAVSAHDGVGLSADVEARYTYELAVLDVEPFGSLHYGRLFEEGYTESGAGSLNLIVQERQTESLKSELGLRAVRQYDLYDGELSPEVTIAWKHDFNADGHPVTAAFAGAPESSFTVDGQETDTDFLVLGGAVTYTDDEHISAFAGFNAEVGQSHGDVSGLLQFEYRW